MKYLNFKNKYRVVADNWCGYEAQVKCWYWPFWCECFGSNTRNSIEQSEKVCIIHSNRSKAVKIVNVD